MRLARIRVENFRSLKDVEMDCDGLTVLVGANGVGKSNILKAVHMFQDPDPIKQDDYYDPDKDIAIELAFDDIKDERGFEQYVHEGEAVIRRVFKRGDGGAQPAFYVRSMQHPKLHVIRVSKAKEARSAYESLAREGYNLPKWTNHDKAKADISAWESEHLDQCELIYDGNAFKKADLGRFLQTIFVPAVHDATAEADDARNSSLAKLTREVVRAMEEDSEYDKFKAAAGKKYALLMERFKKKRLKGMGLELTRELNEIVGGVRVELSWQNTDLQIDLPHTTAKLDEGGNLSTVDRSGHGSQRAFIMAMLQHLAKRDQATGEGERPATVLLIEEPELYQHPTRQRLMARVFASLAENGAMQVMYATHSPHFVGIDRLDHVRLLRKRKDETGHHTEMSRTGMRDVCASLQELGQQDDENSLPERLSVIMTPWINEGFFASTIVLVEGQADYAAITATSKLMGEDLEKLGVSVIPCGGKNNVLPLLVVFRRLQIPCYPVWDSDDKGDEDKKLNEKIWQEAESANPQHDITDAGACLRGNLEKTLKREIGEDLDRAMTEAKSRYHISDDDKIRSKSKIMYEILKTVGYASKPRRSLVAIVKYAVKMRNGHAADPE